MVSIVRSRSVWRKEIAYHGVAQDYTGQKENKFLVVNSYLNCSGYSLDSSFIIEIHTESILIYYFYSLLLATVTVTMVTEPVPILIYKV